MQYLMQSVDKSVVECDSIATAIPTAAVSHSATITVLQLCLWSSAPAIFKTNKQTKTTVFAENVLKWFFNVERENLFNIYSHWKGSNRCKLQTTNGTHNKWAESIWTMKRSPYDSCLHLVYFSLFCFSRYILLHTICIRHCLLFSLHSQGVFFHDAAK